MNSEAMRRPMSALRPVVLMALLALGASTAMAQEPEQTDQVEDRASAFRAVSGPQVESVPGGALLIGAYGAAWVLMLGFFWRVGRLHAQNQSQLERLEAELRNGQG